MTEAEVVPTTLYNIVKSLTKEPEDFHKVKDDISKGIEDLTEARLILASNNTFRINTDLEQRMLDEMNSFAVQGFVKKKKIVTV